MLKKLSSLKSKAVCSVFMLSLIFGNTMIALADNETTTTEEDITSVSDKIVKFIDSLLNPILAIVGAVGTIYCIVLGIKFAKAEEPQEHEKAKNHLKNAIIGFVLIFVLMLVLKLGMPIMKKWVKGNS